MKFLGRLTFLLVLLSLPVSAFALDGGAWTVGPGEWYSEISGSRFVASDQFLTDLRDTPLAGDGRYQRMQAMSYNEIGWTKFASLALGIPFASDSRREDGDIRSISGLTDLQIGLRLRLKDDLPGVILDASWLAPAGYNKNVDPRLGDGRQKLAATIHVGTRLPFVQGFIQASRGFLFVSEDGDVYWRTGVDAGVWAGSRVLLGARYADELPLSTSDELATLPQRYTVGGLMLVRLDDRIDLSFGADRVAAGRNALEGTRIQVALGFKQTKLGPTQGFLGTRPKP